MSINWKKYEKILLIVAFVVMVFGVFIRIRQKNHIQEAVRLPFYSVDLNDVPDGIYYGKTYTQFMHFQVEVEVENHVLKNIRITENGGSQGIKAQEVVDRMIAENKVKVQIAEKDELGSLVVISCVDSALYNGLDEEIQKKYTK